MVDSMCSQSQFAWDDKAAEGRGDDLKMTSAQTRHPSTGNQSNDKSKRSSSEYSNVQSSIDRHPVDRYGFFVEKIGSGDTIDKGSVARPSSMSPEYRSNVIQISEEEQRRRKEKEFHRERKWLEMIRDWSTFSQEHKKKLKRRIEKGIPDSARAFAWMDACDVEMARSEKNFEYYLNIANSRKAEPGDILEIIERDICRTFPGHELFVESKRNLQIKYGFQMGTYPKSVEDKIPVSTSDIKSVVLCSDINGNGESLQDRMLNALQCQSVAYIPSDGHTGIDNVERSRLTNFALVKENNDESVGQYMLRRILRAYSAYDLSVGYCQGMGFIAAMFLTYLPEEESFWLFVAAMNNQPCCMRDLYGVGMAGSQKVLYVADKLTTKLLPKLSKLFAKESIHISMFATQWLITVYTSNFSFDLVTRVWDIFLFEGWKIVYRVMLALLEYATPDLLRLDFEGILFYLKTLPRNVDAEVIMNIAFSIPLKRKHIEFFAKQWETDQKR